MEESLSRQTLSCWCQIPIKTVTCFSCLEDQLVVIKCCALFTVGLSIDQATLFLTQEVIYLLIKRKRDNLSIKNLQLSVYIFFTFTENALLYGTSWLLYLIIIMKFDFRRDLLRLRPKHHHHHHPSLFLVKIG